MQANFGQQIRNTSNVKLPSTINIYTDEELNAVDSGLVELLPPRNVGISTHQESNIENMRLVLSSNPENHTEYTSHAIDIVGEILEIEPELESEFEGEYLPPYTPDILPAYAFSILDIPPEDTPMNRLESIHRQEAAGIAGEISSIRDVPVNDDIEEYRDGAKVRGAPKRRILFTFGPQLDSKLRRVTKRLKNGFTTIFPKQILDETHESRGARKKDRKKTEGIWKWAFPFLYRDKKP
ncbi:hypothetical protein F5Y11DRAFT_349505 [Daldinia sp. FL1419]|nr:hypothetical protein F5Y11DRAFT_349505 [Daldinia sp. FL1419]